MFLSFFQAATESHRRKRNMPKKKKLSHRRKKLKRTNEEGSIYVFVVVENFMFLKND